jgi:hypothetical protein
MCSAEQFSELLASYVADNAPRLFAVVQEYGTRVNARIAGWGLARDGRFDVIGTDSTVYLGASGPDDLLRLFRMGDHVTAHLVWHDPATAIRDDDG